MLLFYFLITTLLSNISVTVTEPVDGETYNGDWLPLRVIVESENQIPDSVHYSLNGGDVTPILRLNTDWPTYMQNFQNHGFSESPAPMDNSILWSVPVTGEHHEFPTPVTANGIVYYTTDSLGQAATDTLFALNAATGEVIWTYDTGYADDAVTVVAGRLYTAADSIYCLDALSGALNWVNGCASRDGGTPVVSNGKVFCGVNASGSNDEAVFCLDAKDGTILWTTVLPWGLQASCMGLSDNRLFIPTTTYYSAPGLCFYALDANDGSILWQNDDAQVGYWDSSPVVINNMIYIGEEAGYVRALNAVTGQTEWETPVTPGESYIAATPVFAYNKLFFGDQVSSIQCLNPADGSFIWSTEGVIQHGSSGVANGILFFGEKVIVPNPSAQYDSASVRAFSCLDGTEIWSYKTACSLYSGHQSSPSITDGVMYYACTDGNLYAFGTGLKYTYREDYFYAEIGTNELVVTSFDEGEVLASDTITFTVTGTGIDLQPSRLYNLSASPNPFVSNASIFFELSDAGFTSVDIYDLTGRCISNLVDNDLSQGDHTVNWGGTDQNGIGVPAGLYMCRIQSGGVIETTGLCLLR